jgi:hypothetical protein
MTEKIKVVSFSLINSIIRVKMKEKGVDKFDPDLMLSASDDEIEEIIKNIRLEAAARTEQDELRSLIDQPYFAIGKLAEALLFNADVNVRIYENLRSAKNKLKATQMIKDSKWGEIVISRTNYNNTLNMINKIKRSDRSIWIPSKVKVNELGQNPLLKLGVRYNVPINKKVSWKGFPDIVNTMESEDVILDVKTFSNHKKKSWKSAFMSSGYNYQIAFMVYLNELVSNKPCRHTAYIIGIDKYKNTNRPIGVTPFNTDKYIDKMIDMADKVTRILTTSSIL